MKFNLKNIIGTTAFLISQGIAAQVYVGIQSGVGNIQSDIAGIKTGNRLGAAIKAGYVYSLNSHFGIGTGIEFSQYKQEVSFSQPTATLSNFEVDISTSAFVYNITTNNYREKQTLQAVQIPLFVQYKKNINTGIDFNFRAGAKYFLPVNYKINATADYANGTAYYPDVNLTIIDLPEYGFGQQNNYSASGEYKTKGIIMSSFELGFTFDMGKKSSLYAAMFLENGYGTILDQNQNETYISYNPTSVTDRKTNGLYSTDKDAEIKPVAFGLTLGWNFK
ncbi:outer membrane beta-barrel protein [Flavobacterium turcicum]|uniref:Outer membrane beta-barrel protein n=1 Tax=Flavobacterium turcicum TaxID=2764718 RepID=A0ABR7JJA5_9FLAO|nr:outer membrane beta-barrel protein [Flavobacterium turcicum]MBC5864572.1 outer membrane beta-barrel protein [Flavobacterium turcicum]NHL02669.1 outer membrane beta-barrel protein [Flavobacterium turcicum]